MTTAPASREGWLFVSAALAAGLVLCLSVPAAWFAPVVRPIACGSLLAAAVAIAILPAARARSLQIIQSLKRPDTLGRRRLSVAVAIASSLYLFIAADLNNRPLVPRLLDEKTYTLQSRMLARGILWRAAHPKAEFFETFYVFDHPLYAPKYFPGTAMLYVPGVWLGIPDWVTSLIIAGAISGLTCLITLELFDDDGAAGICASALLLATNSIHDLGTWVLAHEPVMLCALVMIYAWLQWRANGRRAWAITMGAAAGWGAITRPIDALVYALPMALLIAIDFFRNSEPRMYMRGLLFAALAASPFFILQGVFDLKITGHVFETPYRAYIDQYQPGDAYGGIGSDQKPQTTLQQKLDYQNHFIVPLVNNYRARGPWKVFVRQRLAHILRHGMANRLALILIPAGLWLTFFDRRLLLVALPLPLFALLYAPNPSFIWYYPVIVAPALAILTVAGAMAIAKWQPSAMLMVILCVMAVAIGSIPELSGDLHSDWVTIAPAPVEKVILQNVQAPALVFFTYHASKDGFHDEPVYNLESGWPDDEPIARAQDLGTEKDAELIAYYAAFQPDRNVYTIDRVSCQLKLLGKAGELNAKPTKH